MFDNNDFLNSYKKSLEEKGGSGDTKPVEEAFEQETPDTAVVQDNLSEVPESAQISEHSPEEKVSESADVLYDLPEKNIPNEAANSQNKLIWGGIPSRKSGESEVAMSEKVSQTAELEKLEQSGANNKAESADSGSTSEKVVDVHDGGAGAECKENGKDESLCFDIPTEQPAIITEPVKKDEMKSVPEKKPLEKTGPIVQTAARHVPSRTYEEKSKFVKPELQSHERRYYNGYEPPKKPVFRNIIIAALSILALIVVIVLIASNAGKVEVMDFTGWSRSDLMLWASENEVLMQIDEEFNEQVAADKIIFQSIAAGEKIKKGDFIRVAVSKGPDLSISLMLPDLMNMTHEQIGLWTAENFMTKVRVTTEFSDTIPAGRVIKFEINDNTVVSEVRRDTPIYIYISKGPQDQTSIEVEIPDFKTLGISETVLFAQTNGLNLTIEEMYDDYVPENSIISQTPKAKEKAHKGDTIKVIVSLGKKIFMPNFNGLTKEQAMSLAGGLGINVTIEDRYSSTKEGNFSYQTVDPGVEVLDDTTVTIYYSLGNKIPIASYVGQQLNQLEQWMETVNAKSANITLTKTYTQNSAASGTILQQNKENIFISKGTALSVVISSGQKVFVPNFVAAMPSTFETAITREKAQQMCEDVGLVPIFKEAPSAGRLSGEIWSQSIPAGSEVKQGNTIELKYNTVQNSIVLPDFSGKTEAQVRAMPQFSQLSITFATGNTFMSEYEGMVYAQSIVANTPVPINTAVTLTLGPVKVIDFIGMNEAAIKATSLYTDSKLNITISGTGIVSAQSIAEDTLIEAGTAITLTLS